MSRAKIRYSRRIDTADHHARRPHRTCIRTCSGRLLAPHRRRTSSSTSLAASPRSRSTIRSTARRVSVYISDQNMTTSVRVRYPQPPTNRRSDI